MPFSPLELLQHIFDETLYLMNNTKNLHKDIFIKDETIKRAFIRSLEIIGVAPKKVPEEFKKLYPDIEWRAIAGMRDKLIHDYFGIDHELVWDVIKNKIPVLHEQIKVIINISNNDKNFMI
ncbi:DUF86 domain-containing protein [candidate division KSB1 bacterium]|nr:DUF86 domain-containing protein [candidate division KSB1 bacterium]